MKNDFGGGRVRSLLKEFEVTTEDELFEKLIADSCTLPCSECGKQVLTEKAVFINGDPVCRSCGQGILNEQG
jgi:formylmethanofuran dehydrogenase subunit E